MFFQNVFFFYTAMKFQNLSTVTLRFSCWDSRTFLSGRPCFLLSFSCHLLPQWQGILVAIVVVSQNQQLHSPMYIPQTSLLFEIWYTSTIQPLLLCHSGLPRPSHLLPCLYSTALLLCVLHIECFLLAVMAYDRYLAICSPLHYSFLMSPWVSAPSWWLSPGWQELAQRLSALL